MTKNIFMSYSRRELGFVDETVKKLEGQGYNVWLDYRTLIPGSPWAEQIDKGLKEADTVLLVVSKASLSSEFVELEWRHFLEMDKRVILLIFEAVDLPEELEKYEWVDFRGSYKAGLEELSSQLAQSIVEEHPVPETGFKAPWIVWVTIALSIYVAFASFQTFWTIFVPLLLIPLPYRIYKRSFDFTQVQAALAVLPLVLTLSRIVLFQDDSDAGITDSLIEGFAMGIWSWLLLIMLRTPALQRWHKPEATPPKFINPMKLEKTTPTPVPFFVDFAPQDRAVATEIVDALKKYGHPQAENVHDAKAVFVLISKFKADTKADPEKQVVFPVMLQTSDYVAPHLSKIQWIDFRPGVRGLDVIAQLLPDPKAMLKALGMRPVSAQAVYPPMITSIYYFTLLLAAVFIGASADYMFFRDFYHQLFIEEYLTIVGIFGGGSIALGVLTYFMVNGMLSRTGFFSKLPMVLTGLAVLGVLMFGMTELDDYIYFLGQEEGIEVQLSFAYFANDIFIVGLAVLVILFFMYRHDLRRWFPAKKA